MPDPKRSPIFFDPAEDADDLEAFESRRREPNLDFADVVRELKRSGRI